MLPECASPLGSRSWACDQVWSEKAGDNGGNVKCEEPPEMSKTVREWWSTWPGTGLGPLLYRDGVASIQVQLQMPSHLRAGLTGTSWPQSARGPEARPPRTTWLWLFHHQSSLSKSGGMETLGKDFKSCTLHNSYVYQILKYGSSKDCTFVLLA